MGVGMNKILCAVVGIVLVGGAFAADVVDRTSCAEVKARMDELAAMEYISDADAKVLEELRATYRRDCTPRAGARATRTIASRSKVGSGALSAANSASVAAAESKEIYDSASATDSLPIAAPCDNPDSYGCCPGESPATLGDLGMYCCTDDACFPPMGLKTTVAQDKSVETTVPEKSAEEIAEQTAKNLAKGRCPDGAKPNKYGCCAGAKFKDLGNLNFACCPDDDGDCYPPIGNGL